MEVSFSFILKRYLRSDRFGTIKYVSSLSLGKTIGLRILNLILNNLIEGNSFMGNYFLSRLRSMPYHMRRLDKGIKDQEKLRRVLKETRFVTLALCNDNEPYLVSLSHSYDEEANCIYFHSASEGKKLDYMKANPHVWGQALIDHGYHEGNCSHLYVSVMFKGKVAYVNDISEKRRILSHMVIHNEKNPNPTLQSPTGLANDDALRKTFVGRIDIEEISGKKSAEVDF
jgi:uncharacterized protein